MKKRNFVHRVVGWIERELEATLAILVILAAVTGYSLAATETTAPTDSVTAQQVSVLMYGGKAYSNIVFARNLASSDSVLVRRVTLTEDAPSDVITSPTDGLSGASEGLVYEASVTLSEAYSGSLYVWGKGLDGVTLNGLPVVNSTTPVQVSGSKLTLGFPGVTASITGIGTTAQSSQKTSSVASVFVVPSNANLSAGEQRAFISLVTDVDGSAVNAPITWSISTDPAGAATIDRNTGLVTAIKAGVAKIVATANGKSASATVTISEAKTEDKTIAYPGAPEKTVTNSTQTNSTSTPADAKSNSWNEDWGMTNSAKPEQKSIISQLAELINPSANAATNDVATPAKTVTETLFSEAAVAQRVAETGSANPTNSELKTAIKTMTATQKIVATFQVAAQQIKHDIAEMVNGSKIVDAKGNVVAEKPSAPKAIGQFILKLINGGNKNAGAAPLRITLPDEESGGSSN